MLEGLLTWNWQLWYKLNALFGIFILTVGFALAIETVSIAGMFYMLIYGMLWMLNIMSDNKL